MTIKRGKIRIHKSPNENHTNPWTKIKPKRVTCQKTELFLLKKRNWMNTDFRCPMFIGKTSDIKQQTSETGHQISHNAPMSDVQCPMSNVQCLMSDVWCPMSDIGCLISDAWCPMSDIWGPMTDIWCLISNVRCPISDVWCPLSAVRCPTSDVWYMNSLPDSCRRTTSLKEFWRFHFFP